MESPGVFGGHAHAFSREVAHPVQSATDDHPSIFGTTHLCGSAEGQCCAWLCWVASVWGVWADRIPKTATVLTVHHDTNGPLDYVDSTDTIG